MLPAAAGLGTATAGGGGAAGRVVTTVSVVVVAGTRVRQQRLRDLLERGDVTVLGVARDAAATLELLAEHDPQVLLLDLPPAGGGLDLVERLMARRPLPIVLTGAAALEPAAALARGAVDVVPPGAESLGTDQYAATLLRHLRVASRVRVITHPRGRLREHGGGTAPPARVHRLPTRLPVVAIGASTGGPPALATLLAGLPAQLPAAVIVVQHMAEGFVGSLASWLAGVAPYPVAVANDGDRLQPGQVLLAPSHANLELDPSLRVRLTPPRPGQLHVPEVDTTFRSVAAVCGHRAVGALLTGMGRDGAAGLLAMRARGALTIGQDEQTSAVWGMPAAASALDAVAVELALPDIADGIATAVSGLVEQDSA